MDNRVDNFGDKTRAVPRWAWISRLTSDAKGAGPYPSERVGPLRKFHVERRLALAGGPYQ